MPRGPPVLAWYFRSFFRSFPVNLVHSSHSKSIVSTPLLNWPWLCFWAARRRSILENTDRICRRFSLCVDTAVAFRSSAKARMLCSMGVNPSSFGSHQRTQLSSRKSCAILSRIVPGDMYLFRTRMAVSKHVVNMIGEVLPWGLPVWQATCALRGCHSWTSYSPHSFEQRELLPEPKLVGLILRNE